MQGNMQKNTENAQQVPSPGYETRDTNTRSVLWFAAILFLTVLATFLSMRGLFGYYSASQPLGPAVSPFDSERVLPPEPRLQVDPAVDLNRMRESQEEILQSYGWVDKANGKVRVPIDRAMDLVIKQGLPVRQSAPAQSAPTGAAKEQTK
jgi:hypothetical protein